LPTPLEEAPRLAAALGLRRLWVKREDLSGYALGGNKLRKLDFLLAEAVLRGADTLVTTAGLQSNFCRALAGAAAKTGMGCHLHLRSSGSPELQGNLLLDHLFGARITTTDESDPWSPAITAELDRIAVALEGEGRRPHVVQLTGASAGLGAAAWVSGAAELLDQLCALEGRVAIVVACGSGLTLAGLALGCKHLGRPMRFLGVSVQQPAARLVPWILEAAERAAALIGIPARLGPGDFALIDDQIGPGYGLPTPQGRDAVRLAGRTEALVLDPVYTGKAMAGLAAAARSGVIDPDEEVVFLHSGGTPGLFAAARAFAAEGS